MASITFSGQLDQAMNEAAAEGNKILFIPQQTVGEVLPGAASELVVESDGTYSITLAYNTYSIYHYSDVTKRRTLLATDIVVSADTAVSTIPDLIGSTVPVTEDSVLTIQGYLTEAQDSATAAAASESAVTNRVAAYEVETTEYLINTFNGSTLETGDVVRTLGYYTAGDGGGAEWVKTGETGTASQSSIDTYYGSITDLSGCTYELSVQNGEISPCQLGADSSGLSDSSDALQVSAIYAKDKKCSLHITSGEYLIDNGTRDFRIYGDVTIFGDGIDSTKLVRPSTALTSTPMFFLPDTVGDTDFLNIKDLTIENRWGKDDDYEQLTNNTLSIYNVEQLSLNRVKITNSGAGSFVCYNCGSVVVSDCIVENSARDGIRIVNAREFKVLNNKLTNVLDDSVAVHVGDSSDQLFSKGVVTGNVITDSQGITCLGPKSLVISGNVLTRCMTRGIKVAADISGSSEGHTPTFGIDISNNVITDMLNGSIFDWSDDADAIYVTSLNAESKDIVESYSGGSVVSPYGYLYIKDTETNVNAGTYNLTIQGNKVVRTLPPASLYSDYGFGERFTRNGYDNPEVTVDDMCINSLRIGGILRDTKITGNNFSGAQYGINLLSGLNSNSANIRNFEVSDNLFTDIINNAMLLNGVGVVKSRGNVFDIDPFHLSDNRNSDGSWSSDDDRKCFGSTTTSTLVLLSDGDTFKNTSVIFTTSVTYRCSNPTLFMDPLDDSGNIVYKGIGNLTNAGLIDSSIIVIEDGDPTSSTFRQVKNVCRNTSAVMPTSGVYVKGYVVKNYLVSSASYGWKRVTTGDSHVLDTDWIEI